MFRFLFYFFFVRIVIELYSLCESTENSQGKKYIHQENEL